MVEKFKKDIDNLKSSLEYSARCLYNFWFLTNPRDFEYLLSIYEIEKEEVFRLGKSDEYFKHIFFVNWRTFLLEISKFYRGSSASKSSEKGSFIKFLNKLQSGYYTSCIEVDKEKVREIKKDFQEFQPSSFSSENESILRIALKLRDQYIAHRDWNFYADDIPPFHVQEDGEMILLKAVDFVNRIISISSNQDDIEELCVKKYKNARHLGLLHFRNILYNHKK